MNTIKEFSEEQIVKASAPYRQPLTEKDQLTIGENWARMNATYVGRCVALGDLKAIKKAFVAHLKEVQTSDAMRAWAAAKSAKFDIHRGKWVALAA